MQELIIKAIKNGGATWGELFNDITETSGYLVSLPDNERKHDINDINGVLNEVWRLQGVIQKRQRYNMYVGLWVDGSTVYTDTSILIADKAKAIELGKLYKQKAIYDLDKQESIRLQ